MNKQRKTSHILNVFQYDETTGAVTLPASLSLVSPDSADNSTKVATTAWIRTYVGSLSYATSASVTTAIANLVASAPTTLDTLNELATALGNDPNFATTMSTSLGNRLRIDTATQGLTATQQGYGRTNLGLGTLAILSSVGNGYITDVAWSKLTGVPTTFTPAAHTHVWTDITDRPTNLSSFTNGPGYLTGITSLQVTTALGYTPYNSTNPSGYITGITSGMVTTALGYTPYNSTNPAGYITSSGSISGTANNITAYTINQNLGTGNAPTFTDLYNNQWFRNNNSNTGLYNQVTTQHLSSNTNGYWDVSSTTVAASGVVGIRLYAGGHVNTLRGYFYSDGSGVGILNNQGGWSVLAYQGASYGGELRGSWGVTGKISNGSIWINNGADYNSYNENIRLFAAPNGVSVIAFNASGTGGTPAASILGFSDRLEIRRGGDAWQFQVYSGYTQTSGTSYAAGYRGNANVGGTGEATWHPAGIYSGGTQWLYGTTYRNNANTWDQGQMYFTGNYGYGMVGLYSSTRYQAIFAMGDAYKLPTDGTTTGTLYGLAWSHPNAGGIAGNLNTHGLLVMENGTFLAAISGNIKARDGIIAGSYMFAPNYIETNGPVYATIMYDNNDRSFYVDPNSTSRLNAVVYNDLKWVGDQSYGFLGRNVYADTINGRGSDPLEINYYDGGDVRIGTGVNGSKGLYAGALYDAGSRVAISRGEGRNYVDYSRYVYNNGAYSGSGWIEPSDLGVRYAGTAGYCSGRAELLSSWGGCYNNSHPGYGLRTWYDWSNCEGYKNGITIGSHPGDQSYGFMLWQNMWDDRTYTKRYNGGWQSVRTLLTAQDDGYAYNMNQFVRTSDSPTFANIYANGHVRPYGDYGLYSQDYGGVFRRNTNSYGTWESVGYAKNGWGGYVNNNNYIVSWMLNTSGDFGFLTQNGNWWNLFYNNGNNCWGIGTDNTYSGDGFRCIKYGSSQYGWTTWSDRRAKENISGITGALDTVLAMRGVYFNYINDAAKNKRVGFIAQELELVLPEAVRYAEEIDEYNVEYAQIVSVLTEAIKEQNTQMKAQDAKIQRLEQLVEQLINQ